MSYVWADKRGHKAEWIGSFWESEEGEELKGEPTALNSEVNLETDKWKAEEKDLGAWGWTIDVKEWRLSESSDVQDMQVWGIPPT